MREIRIYAAGAPLTAGPATLTGQAARHLSRVLRRQVGDPVTLFDGQGRWGPAVISRIERGSVELDVLQVQVESKQGGLDTTLALALVRGEVMDRVIQAATELGVTRIQPLFSEHTGVRLSAQRALKKLGHWQRLTASACEQCGRNTLTTIKPPAELRPWLAGLAPGRAREVRLIADPGTTAAGGLSPAPVDSCIVLVGPEGGFSKDEVEIAVSSGFEAIRLGPRILRAGTAALTLVSLIQWQFGDLGGH